MYALLGVGQGSIRGSYLVTIEWNGLKNKSKPLAFVGKGVCFDTGGYSLKPARFMEDMTYDMAGSATVVGLMKNFALRRAKSQCSWCCWIGRKYGQRYCSEARRHS